jgi:4-amino-4-deoxy-L-arabinose transferase-like glycosyltransferase
MNRQTFAWGSSRNKIRQAENWLERLSVLGLFLASLLLFTINLGGLPLRDWDEGTIAQVAKEIAQAPSGSLRWLFPTLWGEAYLNKPPLIHDLIAFFYSFGGINEWTTRLPGALLSALSVPLLYGIGKEIFVSRSSAAFSALIYLTWLPVVRHGRLAMLDGAVLCFATFMFWCVLRSRRDLRWTLGVGIGLGAICLTKGMMGLLLGAIALLFIFWDTPRLIFCSYLWLGLFLGSWPVVVWYSAQWLHYGQVFISRGLVGQSLGRIWQVVEGNQGPLWYYLLEILKYSWPWLLFVVPGLKLAWDNRNWGWAKLVIVWSGVYFAVVSLMVTKLPWYILPIYPALALAGGAKLADTRNVPESMAYPRIWIVILSMLATIATVGCIYFSLVASTDRSLTVIFGSVALTLGVAAFLLKQKDRQFIVVLFWGMYVSLLLFFSSSHWIWELNEAYPVKPVATIVRLKTPADKTVYTSFAYDRPSLNFYSDRQVLTPPDKELNILEKDFPRATSEELKQIWLKNYWQKSLEPYLLLDRNSFNSLKLEKVRTLGEASPNLLLITKEK